MTDSIQHKCGYASDRANLAIAFADMLVGNIIQTLSTAKKSSQYTIIITSDHGHGNTERAIYPDQIMREHQWNSETSILFMQNADDLDKHIDTFKTVGAEELNTGFLPDDVEDKLFVMATRDKASFEISNSDSISFTGKSKYASNHAYYPGTQSDKRFAVISGPNIENKLLENATAEQLFLTCTDILQI